MPDVSIAITAQDRYSSAIKSMSQVTKSFSKDADEMEEVLHKLNTTKYSLKLDADAAMRELKEMEKQFAATGDEADGLKAQLARADYDNIKRNLDLVTKGAKDAERQMEKTGEAFRKADNQSSGKGGFGTVVNALAVSGIGRLAGELTMDAANTLAASLGGDEIGTLFSNALSSAVSGGSLGFMVGGVPGAVFGTAIGGLVGGATGAIQNFQKQDDAFKSYYQEQYNSVKEAQTESLNTGSGIAAGRETDLISFSTLFGDKETAQNYLSDLTTMANTTPFLYGDLTAMSKTLAAYGYGADSILPVLRTIGDTGAALGMQTSDMQMAATAIGRMRTTDKASLEYLNLLQERGIGAVGMLSESYGVSRNKMYELISKGEVSGQKAAEIILEALGDSFEGAMTKQSKTFSGLSSTAEGLHQELYNAQGEGYNAVKSEGLQAEIDNLSGINGEKMKDAYRMMGEWEASLENQKAKLEQDALSAVMNNYTPQTYLKSESRGRLEALAEEYRSAMEAYEGGSGEAGAEMGRILAEAQAIAINEYNASEGAQLMKETNETLAGAIRDDAGANKAYWDAGYSLGQVFTTGLAAAVTHSKQATVDAVNGIQTESIDPYTGVSYGDLAKKYSKNAYGLDYVPRDNFPALLHEGERVLTASQARAADGAGGVSVTFTGPISVREEADLDALARKLAHEVSRAVLLAEG